MDLTVSGIWGWKNRIQRYTDRKPAKGCHPLGSLEHQPAGRLGTGPRGPWSWSWGAGTSHQTPTSSAGRALPHSQHRQAPPAIRKTGCQPPRAECDILSKQASCFTALPWKTSKTYRLQNQRLPVINSFLHLRYLVGGGGEKAEIQ